MGLLDRRRLLMVQRDSIFDTILYADGTMIIAEDPAHHDDNVALHGEVTKTYKGTWVDTYTGSYNNQP